LHDEAHVPAEQQEAEEDARFPGPDEVGRRSPGAEAPAGEGPEAPDRLRDRRGGKEGPPRATFPRDVRLRKRREYRTVYDQGVRVPGRLIVLFALPTDRGYARLGVTATKKVGRAVVRNRQRRLVREVFRRHRHGIGSLDLVVNVRPSSKGCSYRDLERDFLATLHRLRRRLARDARPARSPRPDKKEGS